jgi:hypothetical protein
MTPEVPKSTFLAKQQDALDAAFQAKDADLTAVAASGIAAAWTDWTLVVTAFTGTITAYTVNFAKYLKVGRLVVAAFDVTITTNGTGADILRFSAPVANAATRRGGVFGREVAAVLWAITGDVNFSLIDIYKYDGTYPGADGRRFTGMAIYESSS